MLAHINVKKSFSGSRYFNLIKLGFNLSREDAKAQSSEPVYLRLRAFARARKKAEIIALNLIDIAR
jgi:hypothetical protein